MNRILIVMLTALLSVFPFGCDDTQSKKEPPSAGVIREEGDMELGNESGSESVEMAGEEGGEEPEMDVGLPEEGPMPDEMDMGPQAGEEPIEEVEPPLPG